MAKAVVVAEDVHLGEHEVLEALVLKVQMLLRAKMLQFLLLYVAGAVLERILMTQMVMRHNTIHHQLLVD